MSAPDTSEFEFERAELKAQGFAVYNLWEDLWHKDSGKVLARIAHLLCKSKRIHARKCVGRVVDQSTAKSFFNKHHFYGHISCKYYLGLYLDEVLIAAAGFNQIRMPRKGADYKSSELLRYCNLPGINIAGGLSKLIKMHFNNNPFNDLMSYADKDWSTGKSYAKLNFVHITDTPPAQLYVNLTNYDRLSAAKYASLERSDPQFNPDNFIAIHNSGNMKFVLRYEDAQ